MESESSYGAGRTQTSSFTTTSNFFLLLLLMIPLFYSVHFAAQKGGGGGSVSLLVQVLVFQHEHRQGKDSLFEPTFLNHCHQTLPLILLKCPTPGTVLWVALKPTSHSPLSLEVKSYEAEDKRAIISGCSTSHHLRSLETI